MTTPFLEINDEEVSGEGLAAEVRGRVARRRAEVGVVERVFPAFGTVVACPEQPADMAHPPALYHHLRQVNELYGRPETGPILAASPATRVPVLGRLWRLIREQAHGLVLFYVNRAVAHEVNVNRHLVSVVNQLTWLNQEQQRAIMSLQKEVERLRQEDEKS